MFREIILPIFRSTRLCVTACGVMHPPRCCRPLAGNIVGGIKCESSKYKPVSLLGAYLYVILDPEKPHRVSGRDVIQRPLALLYQRRRRSDVPEEISRLPDY